MTLDFTYAKPNPHRCQPPDILTWGPPATDQDGFEFPTLVEKLPEGTRYHCECGEVLIVTLVPAGDNGYVAWTAQWNWFPETRWQRLVRRIKEGS